MEYLRGWRIQVGILMLAVASTASATPSPHPFGNLPLSFEENEGQTDARVRFLARGPGYRLFLTPTQAVLSRGEPGRLAGGGKPPDSGKQARNAAVSVHLAGANSRAVVSGEEKQPGKSNYFLGNDPSKWRTDVPQYARVRYHDIYPGIDLVYYGNQQQLEFDVQVAPGADPTQVRLALNGIRRLDLSPSGDLIASVRGGCLTLHKPVIYQTDATGARSAVDGRYVLHGRQVAIDVGHYDPTRSLIVDPTLVYSTFIGGTTAAKDNAGSPSDQATGIAVDADGNVYVAGFAGSTNFPTDDPIQTSGDSFIAKLNPSGTALVYATYFGGTQPGSNVVPLCSEPQCIGGIALDATGNLYIAGWSGPGFPTVNQIAGACDANCQSQGGAFIAKLNPGGSALVYSSLIGDASGNAIAVDGAGNAYMVGAVGGYGAGGSSADFPQVNPLQSTCPIGSGAGDTTAYLLKVNATGSALVYSTCIGGSVSQQASGVAVDSSGNVYVAGNTSSPDFPVVNQISGTCVGTCGKGSADAVFVSKINPAGTAFVYSTLVGGSGSNTAAGTIDQDGPSYGGSLALDTQNNVYVTGTTTTPASSSAANNFPTTAGAYQTAASCPAGNAGCANGFLFKINAAGTALVYSTYLGSNSGAAPEPGGVAVDASGNAALVGTLAGMPLVNPVTSTTATSPIVPNIAVIDPTGAVLKFSTPFYETASAVAFDSQGNVYLAGSDCSLFPVTSGAFDTNCTQNTVNKATVSKISLSSVAAPAVSFNPSSLTFSSQTVGASSSQSITVTNTGTAALTISGVTVAGTNAGDYTEANTCNASVSPNAACTINVTFKPSATGARTATLSVADNVSSSPQTIALSGTAAAASDFAVAASPASVTVTAGQSATTTISVTPTNGFNQPVSLACSNLPAGVSCSFAPASVTPNGGAASSTLTIAASATAALVPGGLLSPPGAASGHALQAGLVGALGITMFVPLVWPTRRRALRFVPSLLLAIGLVAGCGGDGGSSTPPPTTSNITVTGTSGSGVGATNHALTIAVTITH